MKIQKEKKLYTRSGPQETSRLVRSLNFFFFFFSASMTIQVW